MKISVAQTFVSADVAANGAAIRNALAGAASEGSRLVLFCEGALSGYAKSQILTPADWLSYSWAEHERQLRTIADTCRELGIFAVVGGAHRLTASPLPHNSVYVISDAGTLLTRYDKRYLSNTELNGWYIPGHQPIVFEVDGYRFGCAICIESQFAHVFSEYERLNVDAVLFSSYGLPKHFQVALQAHSGLNCVWIAAATPAQEAGKGPAAIVGPDGEWIASCPASSIAGHVAATLDRMDPAYKIALTKARPWRRLALEGEIYRDKVVDDQRSEQRDVF